MSELAIRLRKLAIRMRDVRNLMDVKDDDISVNSDEYPGVISETLGGPSLKQHLPHEYGNVLGIISGAEEDDGDEEED